MRLGYLGSHRWRIDRSGGAIDVDTTHAAAALSLKTLFEGATPGREAAERAPLVIDVGGATSTLEADPRMDNGWIFSSAAARAHVGTHAELENFVARFLAQHAEDAWAPGSSRPTTTPFGEAFSFAAFSAAVDRDSLCDALAKGLIERLRASTDPSATFVRSMRELSDLGHDLWSWDDDRVWGKDYITPRAGSGLLVMRSGDDGPPEQDVAIEFRSSDEIGCSHCWVQAGKKLEHGVLTFEELLYGESRFSVALRHCPKCKQRFALVHCTLSQLARDRDDGGTLTIPIAREEIDRLREAGAANESAVENVLRHFSPRKYSITTGGPTWLVDGAIKILPHD